MKVVGAIGRGVKAARRRVLAGRVLPRLWLGVCVAGLTVSVLLTAFALGADGTFSRAWGKDVGGPGVGICTVAANCQSGAFGGLGGEFASPRYVAPGSDGSVYVADFNNRRVDKFDSSGNFQRAWGKDVGGSGVGICTVAANCQAGSVGALGGEFNRPDGVATDANGNVYVADNVGNRIQKFDSSGTFLSAWGKDVAGAGNDVCTVADHCHAGNPGGLGGELDGPAGLATDAQANVYVAEISNRRIDKFDSSGTFLSAWGKDVGGPNVGLCTVAASCQTGTFGTLGGEFTAVTAVATDGASSVYTIDFNNRRVDKFDSSGAFLRAWGKDVGGLGAGICTVAASCQAGSAGARGGEFSFPEGVAADSAGNVYTADFTNNRIDKFDSSGTFLRGQGKDVGGGGVDTCAVSAGCQAGTQSGLGGAFRAPVGIASTAAGDLFVADTGNVRIQQLAGQPPQRTLTVTVSGSGSGTVTGMGIDCSGGARAGNRCSTTVADGTQITLSARADPGSGFTGFTGGGCGAASPCTVTMNADQTVDARFDAGGPAQRTLAVTVSGSGSGTVTGPGIDCSGGARASNRCSITVADGTQITLSARAQPGSGFTGFTGGGCGAASPCTVTMNADQTVDARFDTGGQQPQPPGSPPVNVRVPFVTFSQLHNTFVCNPGTWQNLPANPAFGYEWLRQGAGGGRQRVTISVVATSQTYNPPAVDDGRVFACRVTALNAAGPTVATSVATVLMRTVAPIPLRPPYGNFRIRGIDVFQVVQPSSCAVTFGFPDAGFPCLPGGGTPTSCTVVINCTPIGAPRVDLQRTAYRGVTLDAEKPTAAAVYVDTTEPVTAPTQPLYVTLTARYNGRQIGTNTTRITNPPLSSSPYVKTAERGSTAFGVQMAIPAAWLQAPATQGGTLDLVANVALPPAVSPLLGIQECGPGRDCSADNTFELDGVPATHVPTLTVRTVELRGANQAVGSLRAPSTVLSRVRQVFPGGDGMTVWPYSASIDVSAEEAATGGNGPFGLFCTAFPAATRDRSCRSALLGAAEAGFDFRNPGTHDLTMAVHNYTNGPNNIEPGWTPGGSSIESSPSPVSGVIKPRIFVNDGTLGRPLTAAAHEFGHAIGLQHASAACGGGDGGQVGEPWPADQVGRLQGVKFDRSRGSVLPVTPVVDANAPGAPLFDLMSYCAVKMGTAFDYSAWLSARNWNHLLRILLDYGPRRSAAAAPTPRLFALGQVRPTARAAASPHALVFGIAGPGGGQIVRVVPARGGEAIPAAVPDSPLRLRALDAAGNVVSDAGVGVQRLLDTPGATIFVGSIPAGAATVELVSQGVVLDRKQRNRPPTVHLLAPGRRARVGARGHLVVRWSAGDPDGDKLQATVDYSPDGGRTWRTVYDGPSSGRALVPGSFLEGSRQARVRVFVNDGFSDAQARSPLFRADGTPPITGIVRPDTGEPVRTGEHTLLVGSAFDDHHRPLRGHALTWYAGRNRLGSGERLSVVLPVGRTVLRLVARDQGGRETETRRMLRVASPLLRILQLDYTDRVRHRDRTIAVRISASAPAILRSGKQRFRVGTRVRRIVVRLSKQPATGLLTIPFTLAGTTRGSGGTERGTLILVRL